MLPHLVASHARGSGARRAVAGSRPVAAQQNAACGIGARRGFSQQRDLSVREGLTMAASTVPARR
eukprot:1107208-Pyramimonas_sp.AAC.1